MLHAPISESALPVIDAVHTPSSVPGVNRLRENDTGAIRG